MKDSPKLQAFDCVIIGAGLYGLYCADLLSRRGFQVAVLEKEGEILNRASKNNQGRIHRGYHYPRSLLTAQTASKYYHRFCNDFSFAIREPFEHYYAIAKFGSHTSVNEFISFCQAIDAPLKKVNNSIFFKDGTVDSTFKVEENCFDYLKIREHYHKFLSKSPQIKIYYHTVISSVRIHGGHYILTTTGNHCPIISTSVVINTTYSNVNKVNDLFGFKKQYPVKYELCELAVCTVDTKLKDVGLIVIDGNFFSLMPFGDGKHHTLTSVAHTPVATYHSMVPNLKSALGRHVSSWPKMQKLADKFLKDLNITYVDSIYDIKPILDSSEHDDSRPTITTVHSRNPTFISVLAGKISSIYELESTLTSVL